MDSSGLNYSSGMSSPVLQVEQIYKLAGWTSPLQQSNEKDEEVNDEIISPASCTFPPTFIKLSDDSKLKTIDYDDEEELPIIISELKEINLNSSTQSLPSTTTSMAHKPTSNLPPVTSSVTASTVVLSALPVSFEQIYDLSNRNRKRLKDKQKGAGNTELDDSGHCSISNAAPNNTADIGTNTALLPKQLIDSYDDKVGQQSDGHNSDSYSSFDENIYFNAKPNDDKEDHILHVVSTYYFYYMHVYLSWMVTVH